MQRRETARRESSAIPMGAVSLLPRQGQARSPFSPQSSAEEVFSPAFSVPIGPACPPAIADCSKTVSDRRPWRLLPPPLRRRHLRSPRWPRRRGRHLLPPPPLHR